MHCHRNSEAERKAGELAQDLVKAERKISEQVLRALTDGTVQQLAIHTVGGVVTPAQQLMLAVPRESRLEAEATFSNRDIGFVSEGQDAEVKIDTFNLTRSRSYRRSWTSGGAVRAAV